MMVQFIKKFLWNMHQEHFLFNSSIQQFVRNSYVLISDIIDIVLCHPRLKLGRFCYLFDYL